MADTLDTFNTGSLRRLSHETPMGATRHYFNGLEADARTALEIVAAPGAGRKLILTHLTLSTLTAQSIPILNGTTTTLIGPIQLIAAGASYVKDYELGIELTENTAMYVKSDVLATFHIYIEYLDVPVGKL